MITLQEKKKKEKIIHEQINHCVTENVDFYRYVMMSNYEFACKKHCKIFQENKWARDFNHI